MAAKKPQRAPLTGDEREGIRLAVQSAFRKLKNLYAKIVPHFDEYGFKPPSAGVIVRDLSEKIEMSIIQHCESFTRGTGHCDLARFGAGGLALTERQTQSRARPSSAYGVVHSNLRR